MPEAIGRFSRERAACAIGPSPRLACLASKRHSVPHRDHWVGRRSLDNVGGPKSRTTGPPRSYDRAFKRLIGIDSPVGDESVPGASRGQTARVCRRRSIASRNGGDDAFRRNRQKNWRTLSTGSQVGLMFDRSSNPQFRLRWRLRLRGCCEDVPEPIEHRRLLPTLQGLRLERDEAARRRRARKYHRPGTVISKASTAASALRVRSRASLSPSAWTG
jgi:hypothetical protein